jgi:hypothetical protein
MSQTVNLRSTSVLSRYVAVSDRLATLAKQLEELRAEEKRLRPQVLEEIGDRREIAVRGQVRVLLPSVKESISRACDDETAVEFCKQNGLKYSERSAEYCAPASFSAYVRAGLIPEEMIERKTELTIVVT